MGSVSVPRKTEKQCFCESPWFLSHISLLTSTALSGWWWSPHLLHKACHPPRHTAWHLPRFGSGRLHTWGCTCVLSAFVSPISGFFFPARWTLWLKRLRRLLFVYHTLARPLELAAKFFKGVTEKPDFTLKSCRAWSQSFLSHQTDCLAFTFDSKPLCGLDSHWPLWLENSLPNLNHLLESTSIYLNRTNRTHPSIPLTVDITGEQALGCFYPPILSLELEHFRAPGKWPTLF